MINQHHTMHGGRWSRRLLGLGAACCLFTAACDSDSRIVSGDEDGRPTLTDFQQQGEVWHGNDVGRRLEDGTLARKSGQAVGTDPAHALVPLVFDEDGALHTPESFNAMVDRLMDDAAGKQTNEPEVYFTDLGVYGAVTGDPHATEANAQAVAPEATSAGKGSRLPSTPYVFDPYACRDCIRTSPPRLELTPRGPLEIAKGPRPPLVQQGDAVVAWRTSGTPGGHSGLVYETSGSAWGDPRSSATITMEARGYASTTDGVDGAADEVAEMPLRDYFLADDVFHMRLLRSRSTTAAQRAAAAAYAKAQDPDRYELLTSKWTESRWYCSKLNWAAYKRKAGLDLDSNGGYFVLPRDLIYSPYLETVYVYEE